MRKRLKLLRILRLRIPLPRLQNKDTNQHQRQDRITSAQNLQTILATKNLIPILSCRRQISTVLTQTGQSETLHDIGDVDGYTAHVEDEGGAVEEHV